MKRLACGLLLSFGLIMMVTSCNMVEQKKPIQAEQNNEELDAMKKNVQKYVTVKLTSDIAHLSANEKEMLKLLFNAAKLMDDIFWMQNYGDKQAFLSSISDPDAKKFAEINYGPWDEMDNLKPFIEGYGEKPAGSEFYPHDMTKEEFEKYNDPNKSGLYTIIRRNDKGELTTLWYHEAYKPQVEQAAELLRKASRPF